MSKLRERLRDPVRSGVYRVARSDAIDEAMHDVAHIDLKDGDALRAIRLFTRHPSRALSASRSR